MHTGLAVITGTEDRQHAYVALTRGTDDNTAYVFTAVPEARRPGARPAPGPRTGPLRPAHRPAGRAGPAIAKAAEPEDALGVLAEVLGRDGQQLSASQTWQQALADADHLAILHAIWTAETTPAREQRYRDLLAGRPAAGVPAKSPATRRNGCGGRCAPRNWPAWTPAQVLADAVGERDLAGARDIARRHRRPDPPPHRRPRPAPGRRRGPRRSPTSPTPNAARTPRRSPR